MGNLETMQKKLQRQVRELQIEVDSTKGELGLTKAELDKVQAELDGARDELIKVTEAKAGLENALYVSQEEARRNAERVDLLEGYLMDIGVDASSVGVRKVEVSTPCMSYLIIS